MSVVEPPKRFSFWISLWALVWGWTRSLFWWQWESKKSTTSGDSARIVAPARIFTRTQNSFECLRPTLKWTWWWVWDDTEMLNLIAAWNSTRSMSSSRSRSRRRSRSFHMRHHFWGCLKGQRLPFLEPGTVDIFRNEASIKSWLLFSIREVTAEGWAIYHRDGKFVATASHGIPDS